MTQLVPNSVKIEINATGNGIPVVNIVHAKFVSAPTDADLLSVADAVQDWYQANKGNFHPTYVLQNVTVTDLSVANGHQVISNTVSGAGTGIGAAAANNVAVCASLRTLNTGRSFRGRMYFGGLAAGTLESSTSIAGATAAAYANMATDLIDALDAVGAVMCVLSRVAAGVLRVVGLMTEIVGVIVDTKIDSQRRRTAN